MRILIIATFDGLAAFEFWRGRGEALPSRSILFWLFSIYAAYTSLRIPFVEYLPAPLGVRPTQTWSIIAYNGLVIIQALLASTFMIGLSYERVAQQNYRMANLDPLTGIPNRRGLDAVVKKWAPSAERTSYPTSVLLFDLDNFKAINDRFGHGIGDHVIVCAVQTAKDVLRHDDEVFRIGGEEFVCFLPKISGQHAVNIAERIRSAFRINATTISGHPVRATLSVGVASFEGGQGDIDQLLNRADDALYKAKRGGRNRTVLWTGATGPSPELS
jgi:diguanylate cyclase (GGDEF)-like protein